MREGTWIGVSYAIVGVGGEKKSVGMNFFIPIYDTLKKLNDFFDRARGRIVTD